MIQLGISTACFYPQPLEEILPVLAGLGVHAIEIFFNTESEFRPAFYRQLGEQAKALGLDIVSVHPYTSLMEGLLLFSDYARRTEDGLAQYERYFTCAAALGARFLTFHGERDMGRGDDPARWPHRAAVYHRLCALAQSCGVTLAQENVAWCRSREAQFVRQLRQAVPELHFTLDIKQAHRAGADWRDQLNAMGSALVNVHINDFSSTESCLLPGAGTMDYADLFARLRGVGYRGHTLIEVYRQNFAEAAELGRAVRVLSRFCAV